MFTLFPSPFIDIPSRRALVSFMEYHPSLLFTALSPPYAGCSLGIPWWQEVMRDRAIPSILDCGASMALAMDALQHGIDGVVCRHMRSDIPTEWRSRLFSHRPFPLTNKETVR